MLIMFYKSGVFCYECESKKFKSGMVGTFTGNRKIKLCDDKSFPVGFFSQDSDSSVFGTSLRACLIMPPGEFQTDVFEKSDYKVDDFLYCSENGMITNEKKYRGNIILGIVNFVEKENIGFVTCLARNIEK